ncbi:hypothetical protein NW072_02235 [Mycoplasmopsis felis]|uniref:hypothetical protein n=1 Tax=Mycoplasmopsis felis TaxID=33923 RepID=UPI0021AF1936|nr:hypothetical protein [Mycoplasmopsis felis]UWV79946.1 hypothetical protein NW072_02235 [Mycoplasmopsis felis]
MDSIGKDHNKILGLARTITNENYVRQAKQTFHIGFSGTKIPVHYTKVKSLIEIKE